MRRPPKRKVLDRKICVCDHRWAAVRPQLAKEVSSTRLLQAKIFVALHPEALQRAPFT
jgi:hypothetical protein